MERWRGDLCYFILYKHDLLQGNLLSTPNTDTRLTGYICSRTWRIFGIIGIIWSPGLVESRQISYTEKKHETINGHLTFLGCYQTYIGISSWGCLLFSCWIKGREPASSLWCFFDIYSCSHFHSRIAVLGKPTWWPLTPHLKPHLTL